MRYYNAEDRALVLGLELSATVSAAKWFQTGYTYNIPWGVIISLETCLGLSAVMMQRQVVDCPARLLEEGYKFEQVSGYDVGQCSIDEPFKLYTTPKTELHRPRIWINFARLR